MNCFTHLITVGGASIGLLAAVGGAAPGLGVSVGGLAVGSIAIGGVAVGFVYEFPFGYTVLPPTTVRLTLMSMI